MIIYSNLTELTQELLHQLFDYKDGELYWKVCPMPAVKVGDMAGALREEGYKTVCIMGKMYLSHRLIFVYHHGYFPEIIDHIDGNKYNHRIENLREANLSQNQWNSKKPKTNKSGYKGVCWHPASQKWLAYAKCNGKRHYLGVHANIQDAVTARQTFVENHHGAFLNHG